MIIARPSSPLLTVCVAAVLASAALPDRGFAQESPRSRRAGTGTSENRPAVDTFDLVFLGPQGPVFFRLQVNTGTHSVTATRREYAAVIFRTLDADGSGFLEPGEAERIPQNGQLGTTAGALGGGWKELDTEPQDNRIQAEELFQFVDQRLGPRFRVQLKTRLQQSVRLSGPLDVDGDHHVSRAEIENGLSILVANDFDDDGTISVAELQPYPTAIRQAMLQQEARREEQLPLMVLTTPEERETACRQLLNHYSAQSGEPGTAGVPCERIGGLSEEEIGRFDRDGDGRLGSAELLELMSGETQRLTITALIPRNAVQVTAEPRARHVERQSRLSRPTQPVRTLEYVLAGMPVTLRSSNNREGGMSDSEVVINQALVGFLQADTDKNRYLNTTEYAQLQTMLVQLGLAGAEFAGLDADGDGMLTRDELKTYVETNAALSEATLVLTVSDDAKTLFEILDANLDNRLSPRELQEGFGRVRRYDHDRDGRLGMTELRSQYGFVVSPDRPQFLVTALNTAMMQGAGVPRITAATSGPTWYRKMDRNQDGDIGWREFLGTREDFERIDRDRNGLIDLNEATAVE